MAFTIGDFLPRCANWLMYERLLYTADLQHVYKGLQTHHTLANSHFLAAMVNGQPKGLLIFLTQPIGPEMDMPVICDGAGHPLIEAKVRAFYVEPAHRNQGLGTALQKRLLQKAQELGCYQVRSRSELDKEANYVIKLKLGFAMHPALRTFKDGRVSAGVYWVKVV